MKRLSQSLKQLLFNRDNGFKEEEDGNKDTYSRQNPGQEENRVGEEVKQPVAQRLSLPKINLDQLAAYLKEPDPDAAAAEPFLSPLDTDSCSGGTGTSGRSESTPSPPSNQHRLTPARKSPTPTFLPGFSPKGEVSPTSALRINVEQPHASCGKNTARTVSKLERLLKRGHDNDDRPGFVYILRLPRDATQPYYKLRFSSVELAKEDVSPLTKECKVAVTRYAFAEEFLILLLDSMRILRYPLDDDPPSYHTYHKATRKLIADAMSELVVAKPRPLARPEENWVMMSPDALYRIVQQCVAMIDSREKK